jgi:hypothetical protein
MMLHVISARAACPRVATTRMVSGSARRLVLGALLALLVWSASGLALAQPLDAGAHPSASAPGPRNTAAASGKAPAAASGDGADSLAESDSWGQDRRVGSHRFIVAAFIPSALAASHLGIRAGIEYHQVPGYAELPSLVRAQAQAVDLRTINVAETIDVALRLHDYVAVFGDAYGRARVGANISTLLGTGADYTYGGDVGVLVKLFRLGGLQLAARGQVGVYAGQMAGIVTLFQDLNAIALNAISRVEQSPTLDLNSTINQLNGSFLDATADLLTPFDGFVYGGSLNAAQSLGRYVGLQASLGISSDSANYRPTAFNATSGVPVTSEYQVHTLRPSVGAALDLDLDPAGLPLAFMLEYRASAVNVTRSGQISAASESSVEHLLALGAYYSGRTDLQLGVTTYTLFGQTPALGANAQPSGKPLDLAGQFVFRYFW